MKRILLFSLWLVFTNNLVAQTQIGSDINGELSSDSFGSSVSISGDGNVLAIGAPNNSGSASGAGHVRVYQKIANAWVQIGLDIDGEAAGDNSGFSVSLSSNGSVLAIGALYNDGNGSNSGHVRVYQNVSNTWVQIGTDINGEIAGDQFGCSVTVSNDGSIVAVGAKGNDGNGANAGHVRVFQNVSSSWVQVGADIDGVINDQSGSSVSISGDGNKLAIGSPSNNGNGISSGCVRVYQNNLGSWVQIGTNIVGEAANDNSGISVSFSNDGTTLAIGAPNNDGNGSGSGHVRVFQNVSSSWVQIGSDINGEAGFDSSGNSVSLSSNGNILAIGAQSNIGTGLPNSGHVRLYKNTLGTWSQIGNDINGEANGDLSGISISLSNDGLSLAIGAPYNDGSAANSGHVRVYDLFSALSIQKFNINSFSIYPNPVTDTFQLETDISVVTVEVVNLQGQIIKTFKNQETFNISDIPAGIYLIIVNSEEGKGIKKIIKN